MTTEHMQLAFVARQPSATAVARATFVKLGRGLWRPLEAHGRNRAMRTLLEIADARERTAPDVARQIRAACRWIAASGRADHELGRPFSS